MPFLRPTVAVACATAFVLLATPGRAAADRDDDVPPRDDSPPPARWSVGFNPLAVAIGRYGFDGEYVAARHVALVANIHGDYASKALPAVDYDRPAPIFGFGGEAGVRFYPSRDLYGFFFGLSAVSGVYDVDYYGARLILPDVGIAMDIGAKYDLGSDFFLGLGAGVQDLWTPRYPKDIAPGVSFVLGAGVDPRLLVTFGTVIR